MTSKSKVNELDPVLTARWESGELGRSDEHAELVDPAVGMALDDGMGLQLVSIRLQRSLIDMLKSIAKYRGVAYQPLIRDLLNRFAISELQQIAYELQKQQDSVDSGNASVVDRFMAREHEPRKSA